MKTMIRYLLILVIPGSQLFAQTATTHTDSGTTIGEVTKFYKDKTSCYCSEDRSSKITLNSSKVKGFDIDILECGEKNLLLINLPNEALKTDGGCETAGGTETSTSTSCWVKKNYIRYAFNSNINCDTNIYAGDPNEDDKPLCKDLGSVVGAGSCIKEERDPKRR